MDTNDTDTSDMDSDDETSDDERWRANDPDETIVGEPPPAFIPPPVADSPPGPPAGGLVRDPFATFGGVASGIAHRYGWDVALTRLAFIIVILLTGGTAFFVYLLAWLIIPRANYWPPANARARTGGITARELGFGLAAVGVLIYLAVGTGSAGSVLVPVALVAGGVWLLLQNPRTESSAEDLAAMPPPVPAAAAPAVASTVGVASAADLAAGTGSGVAAAAGTPAPPYIGRPVPPRGRGRKWLLRGVIAVAVVLALALIAIPIAILVAVSDGSITISSDNEITHTPTVVEDIPSRIDVDAADLRIDLSRLEAEDFDGVVTPVDMDIDVGAGAIQIVLPEDLPVEVDAEIGLGEIVLLDRSSSGIASEALLSEPDAVIEMTVDLGAGEITVDRAGRP